jgi:hypothetical protein
MSIDQSIGVLGVALTVLFGVLEMIAAKYVKRKSISQKQRVDAGGIGIQSGRDTKLGHD